MTLAGPSRAWAYLNEVRYMTRSKKVRPHQGPKVPRFTQFRCQGTTPDGIEVTSAAMKVRLYRNGVVVLFKGRTPDGRKGAFSGIFKSIEELAALELAASQARAELNKSPPKVKKGGVHA